MYSQIPLQTQDKDELKGRRTLNSKVWSKPNGSFALNAHVGHIHYFDKFDQDGSGKRFREIDTNLKWNEQRKVWYSTYASYQPSIPEYADSWLTFRDVFEGKDQSILIRPLSEHIKGTKISDRQILYENAFGAGIDLRLGAGNNSLRKEVIIREKPTDLTKDLEFEFEVKLPLGKDVSVGRIGNKELINLADRKLLRGKQLMVGTELADGKEWHSYLRTALIWDSGGNAEAIQVEIYKDGDKLILKKILPKEFLEKAVYPVFTDTTTSYYCGAGDGMVKHEVGTWETIHNAATGSNAYPTLAYADALVQDGGTNTIYIKRTFFPTLTSAIPDAADILGAIFYGYLSALADQDDDAQGYIALVQTTQDDPSTLITADYSQCGSIDNPTQGGKTDLSNLTNEQYNTITFTENPGWGWINKTGITVIGVREGHDCEDNPIANSSINRAQIRTSEDTDGNKDPYISVTYTPPAPTTQTVTAKASIKKTATKTVTAKAAIKKSPPQTITAKGSIKKLSDRTLTAKGRIRFLYTQTVTARGRIAATTARTVTAKAAVKRGASQTVTAKAAIERTWEKTVTSKARIQITTAVTITVKGALYNVVEQAVTAKAAVGREFAQSLTAKARIQITSAGTVTAKANIVGIVTRTITAKGKITQTTTRTVGAKANISAVQFITAKANIIYGATPSSLTDTIREISAKLEIKWDGNTWTDETDYFLNAGGNERINSVAKDMTASEVDLELDNTNGRFLPENTSSPIYAYLNTNVEIRLGVIIENSYYRMFTGRIRDINPDRRTSRVDIHCIDNTSLLVDKSCPRALYEDKRTDQLILPLLQEGGITDYEMDQGDHTVDAAWFKDLDILPTISALCVAERGMAFFDRFGKFVFWNRTHLDRNATKVILTRDDILTNFVLSVKDSQIRNRAEVRAKPRASAGVQVVWTNGNIVALNPYTDTLVWVPAHDQQVAYLEMEDPCTGWITPVANTDYTANTLADGSGTDRTANISIEFTAYADACYVTVINTTDDDIYLTKFQVRANPLKVWTWIKIVQRHETSISLYGERTLEIDNDFITSEDTARVVAEAIINRAWEAQNVVKVNILGLPNLICGDIVTVEITDSDSKNYMIENITWQLDERGFLESFTLVNPYEPATQQTVTAIGRIS